MRSGMRWIGFIAIVIHGGFGLMATAADVEFGRQIRPLLAEKCFACHGLDEDARETDLRLDTREGLFAETESGTIAVVAGNASKSEIYRRIITDDEDERMPPVDANKDLEPEEIELVRLWIDQGAAWQQHWSLIPPEKQVVPRSKFPWARNEIDHFVRKRLESVGLTPASEADKPTLIRRVTFDLTGLPPTPDEVDDFLADDSDSAYEKVVDRLLRSSHYGEHMARYWLDAARYGDTHGLHLDNFRQMWPYRDWVINAFNSNMRFDQFSVEQLAGDLLPNPTLAQKIATGFNRCNVTTSEGGVIPEEYYVHYTNDRVSTMSTVWMGVSMGCVTCHDHKFDPYQMKDFYQLFAFFNSLDGPVMDGNKKDTAPVAKVASPDQRVELSRLTRRISLLTQLMAAPLREVDQDQKDWEARLRAQLANQTRWKILVPQTFKSSGGAAHVNLDDHSILVSGENPAKETYEITTITNLDGLLAIRLEGLTHDSLGGNAGRSENGNVVLSEFELEIAPIGKPENWQTIKLTQGWADHEQADGAFQIANSIDGDPDTGWATDGHRRREDRTAIFMAENRFGFAGGTRLRIRLRHESVYGQHQFGRIRLAATTEDGIPQMDASFAPAEIVKLLGIDREERSESQRNQIRDFYRNNVTPDETLAKAKKELDSLREKKEELDADIPTTLIWKEKSEPKPAFILLRGAYDKKGEQVTRNTPAALPPLNTVPDGVIPNRLHLARWLFTPEHPLTSRVTVNRLWQQLFGVGIVKTSEDFGSQGEPPSHPQLLDWLAVDFRENGWNVKRLLKKIVMSATYRQSSKRTESSVVKDLDNRLFSRGPRFRLDAEVIRDTALATSGLLVREIGGPSVKPYQPPGIWYSVGYTDSNTANFKRDSGDALFRRSLYTFWKRTAPPPALVTLDAPSRENCTVRRSRTNTPLAALALLNDEQFVEASRKLAERTMTEGGQGDGQRASYAFRIVTARLPTDGELKVLLDIYRSSLKKYRSDYQASEQLLQVGESDRNRELDSAELAAWSIVANLLLNLDETVTKN